MDLRNDDYTCSHIRLTLTPNSLLCLKYIAAGWVIYGELDKLLPWGFLSFFVVVFFYFSIISL